MNVYLYYSQTPELAALPSQKDRDAVHAMAWRKLRSEQPRLWTLSFFVVICSAAVACLLAYPFLQFVPAGPWKVGPFVSSPQAYICGVGAGIGALVHVHRMATALRPYYAKIISERYER